MLIVEYLTEGGLCEGTQHAVLQREIVFVTSQKGGEPFG
jgi:hypothetical protein